MDKNIYSSKYATPMLDKLKIKSSNDGIALSGTRLNSNGELLPIRRYEDAVTEFEQFEQNLNSQ